MEAALNFHDSLLKSALPFSNLELFDPQFFALLAEYSNQAGGSNPVSPGKNAWHVFASFEGIAGVMERIQRELKQLCDQAHYDALDARNSQQWSDALRESFVWLKSAAVNAALLRIVLPQWAPGEVAELRQPLKQSTLRSAFALCACNVAYLALLSEGEDTETNAAMERCVFDVYSRAAAKNGSATVLHSQAWLKDRINVWGTKRADFPLMQRVKQAFDPHNLFAPGRFMGGL
jgi:FAD/FMN-containing dehydrogenase